MTWHYAFSRKTHDDGEAWHIVEVYLGDDGELRNWSGPREPFGETWQECLNDLAMMGRASQRHYLDLDAQPPVLRKKPPFGGGRMRAEGDTGPTPGGD